MKAMKVTVMLAASLLASVAAAQSTPPAQAGIDSDIALLRSDVQADKTAIVTRGMQLNDDQGKLFWPLYREYANKQQILGDQRVSIIKDYATAYDSMDDATADGLTKRQLKYEQDRAELREDYYPKFKKAVGAKQAAKFMQIDNRLSMLIDLQLAAAIPILK